MVSKQGKMQWKNIKDKILPLSGLINGSKQLSDISITHAVRYRRNALGLFLICTIGLIPWTIFLATSLSPDYHTHHWRLAWTGFDGLLFIATATTSYLGWRRRQAVIGAAIVTATLLICDAWFDITLDLGTSAVWGSVASALFIELPLAIFILRRVHILVKLSIRHIYQTHTDNSENFSLWKLPMFAFQNDETKE